MAEKLCLGPIEPTLVPAFYSSHDEVVRAAHAALERLQIGPLVKMLTKAQQGACVRAPRGQVPRRSTGELLHAAID